MSRQPISYAQTFDLVQSEMKVRAESKQPFTNYNLRTYLRLVYPNLEIDTDAVRQASATIMTLGLPYLKDYSYENRLCEDGNVARTYFYQAPNAAAPATGFRSLFARFKALVG